jgi:hypothetical protein
MRALMPVPSKRFCVICGVERPIEDFLRDGALPRGNERNRCTRNHSERGFSARARKKHERKVRQRKVERDAITVEVYQTHARRKAYTARTAFIAPGLNRGQYEDYLRSDHWLQFREQYKANPDVLHACYVCGAEDYDLHHRFYGRLGCEAIDDVVPLCRKHHRRVHRIEKSGHPLRTAHIYVRNRYLTGDDGQVVSKIENSISSDQT